MNVKELKEVLIGLPDDMEVIMKKDSEANGYSPLSGSDYNNVYIPHNTWSGDVYSMEWKADDACMESEDWEILKLLPRALILIPVN